MIFPLALVKVRLGLSGRFRAFGDSMQPVISSGSWVAIEPVDVERIAVGDIVAAKVGDETMLHLVTVVDHDQRRVEIAGTSGPANGWTTFDCVYAICTRIEGSAVPGAHTKTRRRSFIRLANR